MSLVESLLEGALMLVADQKTGVYHVASSEFVSRVQLAAKFVVLDFGSFS